MSNENTQGEAPPINEHDVLRVWHDQIAKGHLDQAENTLRDALVGKPNSPGLLRTLSDTLRRAGKFGEAASAAMTAVQRNPSDAQSYHLLAGLHLFCGNLPAALAAGKSAYAFAPTDINILCRLSEITCRQGDIHAAHSWADRAVEAGPKNPWPLVHRANAHLVWGELDHARAALQDAGALAPTDKHVKQRLDYLDALIGRDLLQR
jgi:predicted Zn-dependent protease